MDPSTLTTNANTFQVLRVTSSGEVPISGTVSYDAAFKKVTFTSSQSLAKGTYQATITTAVEDKAGNALASAYIWRFST